MADWRLNNLKDVSMILATRGIGKSDIITCLVSLYLIYKDPLKSLIIITDKATKAQRLLKYVKDIIVANQDFFSDIFDLKNLLNSKITTLQNKRKEPSIFYGSLGETLRGIHPDYVVFDDILTRETSWSSATRESVFEKYEEVKKLTNNILIIGNVCHPLDLYTKIRHRVPLFEIYHDSPKIPDWLKPDLEKERLEGSTEASIMANYFGVLLPDEEIPFFDIKIMKLDSINGQNLNYTCFFDFSQGKNDANALTIAFLYNFKCYLLGFAKVCRWSDFIKEVSPILNELGIKQVFYENNTTGDEPVDHFNNYGIRSFGLHSSMNKISKINRMISYIDDLYLVRLDNKLNQAYISDFKNYNPRDCNSKDDAPDSAVMCLMKMGFVNEKLDY